MPSPELRARREAIVREHLASENAHDFDTTIATFEHPRYELVATGDVYDGEEAVRGYFAESRQAFPDQRNELVALHHADDAVIAEVDLLGTHLGPLRALPPTGRAFRCRLSAHFLFERTNLLLPTHLLICVWIRAAARVVTMAVPSHVVLPQASSMSLLM